MLRSTTTEINDPVLAQRLRYFIKLVLPIAASAFLPDSPRISFKTADSFSREAIAINMGKISQTFPVLQAGVVLVGGLFNLAKSLIKVSHAFVAYLTIRGEVPRLVSMLSTSLWQAIVFVASLAARIILVSAIIFIAISVPDYVFQRRQFIESLKMTRQEIKEEYKQMEGDPLVKSRLRQRMRELLSQNMMVNVPKADVVITNPTHFAVAMQWDRSTMRAPMLTAKGADLQAQRIKQLARENDVPIVENKPLARALYAEVEIGDMIPDEYYQALAVILAKFMRLTLASSVCSRNCNIHYG